MYIKIQIFGICQVILKMMFHLRETHFSQLSYSTNSLKIPQLNWLHNTQTWPVPLPKQCNTK